jgi:hypothetical protein
VYRRFLSILGRREAKLNATLAVIDPVEWHEIVRAELVTVGGDQINLVGLVLVADVAVRCVPTAHEVHVQDLAVPSGALALNAIQPRIDPKHQVAARMFGQRLEDIHTATHSLQCNGHLADRSAKIRIHHEHMFARPLAQMAR